MTTILDWKMTTSWSLSKCSSETLLLVWRLFYEGVEMQLCGGARTGGRRQRSQTYVKADRREYAAAQRAYRRPQPGSTPPPGMYIGVHSYGVHSYSE